MKSKTLQSLEISYIIKPKNTFCISFGKNINGTCTKSLAVRDINSCLNQPILTIYAAMPLSSCLECQGPKHLTMHIRLTNNACNANRMQKCRFCNNVFYHHNYNGGSLDLCNVVSNTLFISDPLTRRLTCPCAIVLLIKKHKKNLATCTKCTGKIESTWP